MIEDDDAPQPIGHVLRWTAEQALIATAPKPPTDYQRREAAKNKPKIPKAIDIVRSVLSTIFEEASCEEIVASTSLGRSRVYNALRGMIDSGEAIRRAPANTFERPKYMIVRKAWNAHPKIGSRPQRSSSASKSTSRPAKESS